MRYVLLVALWIAWCTLHSVLISPPMTGWFQRRLPQWFTYYRLAYNLFAAASLLPVLLYGTFIRSEPIVTWHGAWRIVPILLGAAALFFFAAGARRYDLRQFLGLRQIADNKTCSVLTDDCALDTGGVLSMVRHPWYIGGMLVIWARPLDLAAILTNLVISAYFVVGTLLEERKLVSQFGRQYTDYQQRVSMLLPVKWARQALLRRR